MSSKQTSFRVTGNESTTSKATGQLVPNVDYIENGNRWQLVASIEPLSGGQQFRISFHERRDPITVDYDDIWDVYNP